MSGSGLPPGAFRFVLTLTTEEYDYDGMYNEFAVLGEFSDPESAKDFTSKAAADGVRIQLEAHPSWKPTPTVEGRLPHCRVNEHNRVVHFFATKTWDGTHFCSIYSYFEVIEVLADAVVDARMFNLDVCRREVERYFRESHSVK